MSESHSGGGGCVLVAAGLSRLPRLSVRYGVCLLLDWMGGWLVGWPIHSFTHSEKQASRVVEGRALGERVHSWPSRSLTSARGYLSTLFSVSSLKQVRTGPA